MADDFVTNAGSGGKTFRSLDDGTRHWPASVVSWVTVLGDPDTVVTPVAAALADGTANPTAILIGCALEIFNGTTWDRVRGDTTNGVDVDVTRLPALVAGSAVIGAVTQSGTWNVTVNAALPAGTNNIGDVDVLTLPALPAGTNNIGDVDVLTLPAGSVAAATSKTADYDTGAGTDTVMMVGFALPASGGAVAGGTSTNPFRTDPTGTTTQPVSLATLPALVAGTANIGDVDVLTLPALPAGTNNIGDVDVLTLPALVAGTANIGDVDVLTQPARVATTDSITAKLATDAIQNGLTALTPKFAFANVAASSTDASLVAAVASKKLRVLSYVVMTGGTATNVTFNSKPAGAGAAISMLHACGANGGVDRGFSPVGHFETVSGEGLTVTTGAGSTTGIQVCYIEV